MACIEERVELGHADVLGISEKEQRLPSHRCTWRICRWDGAGTFRCAQHIRCLEDRRLQASECASISDVVLNCRTFRCTWHILKEVELGVTGAYLMEQS
jgi:hypothetical protein